MEPKAKDFKKGTQGIRAVNVMGRMFPGGIKKDGISH